MSPGPDARRARGAYERHADRYDNRPTVRYIESLQRQAIGRLTLAAGERVLDVACGTGLAFAPIEDGIGPEGKLVGVDLSGAMLERARARARDNGWSNVHLVEDAVQDAELGDEPFDAALLSFAHDVLQSDEAVDRIVAALRPGGRIATTGIQWAPRWALPVNAAVWLGARRYVTTFDGLDRPWRKLEARLTDVHVERRWLGAMYVVGGRVPTRSLPGHTEIVV